VVEISERSRIQRTSLRDPPPSEPIEITLGPNFVDQNLDLVRSLHTLHHVRHAFHRRSLPPSLLPYHQIEPPFPFSGLCDPTFYRRRLRSRSTSPLPT